jgi:PiT family inorganic phosphate transporter
MATLIELMGEAYLFDHANGFLDSANFIATRVPRPRVAVAWAAFFNFIAFEIAVADTIGQTVTKQ